MNIRFKIRTSLLETIRDDLRRPHAFAGERVGFVLAGLARTATALLIIAHTYRPVADEDYLPDRSVGAMIGPDAIRKAMEWALFEGVAIFHVHSHGGIGIPGFSGIDRRESAKFVPDFLKAAPQKLHGAIVISNDAAAGNCWFTRDRVAPITEFVQVGTPLRKWGSR
ncbi:MAG: hypothetical protein ACLQAT_01040 [Candidatus Binataceae bacterium]